MTITPVIKTEQEPTIEGTIRVRSTYPHPQLPILQDKSPHKGEVNPMAWLFRNKISEEKRNLIDPKPSSFDSLWKIRTTRLMYNNAVCNIIADMLVIYTRNKLGGMPKRKYRNNLIEEINTIVYKKQYNGKHRIVLSKILEKKSYHYPINHQKIITSSQNYLPQRDVLELLEKTNLSLFLPQWTRTQDVVQGLYSLPKDETNKYKHQKLPKNLPEYLVTIYEEMSPRYYVSHNPPRHYKNFDVYSGYEILNRFNVAFPSDLWNDITFNKVSPEQQKHYRLIDNKPRNNVTLLHFIPALQIQYLMGEDFHLNPYPLPLIITQHTRESTMDFEISTAVSSLSLNQTYLDRNFNKKNHRLLEKLKGNTLTFSNFFLMAFLNNGFLHTRSEWDIESDILSSEIFEQYLYEPEWFTTQREHKKSRGAIPVRIPREHLILMTKEIIKEHNLDLLIESYKEVER